MHKSLWIAPILAVVLAILLVFTASSAALQAEGLLLSAPTACPSGGCAAGQRLNFQVEFSIDTSYTGGPNTQVCVYAPSDGNSGAGSQSWVKADTGWIAEQGALTGETYAPGEQSSVCTSHIGSNEALILSAYATLSSSATDQLDFAFNIKSTTDIDGKITVKVFQKMSESVPWTESDEFSQTIPVAQKATTAYVAQNATRCGSNSPCFVNSGDDKDDGLGTGLRDAILTQNEGDEIIVLGNLALKSHTVLIDEPLTIRGETSAQITYIGSDCSNPMLKITDGVTLQDLTIHDGNCTSPSRDLIEVDSAEAVVLEHLTLQNGKNAVLVRGNTGDVTVAFNHISDNTAYAVLRENGTGSGKIEVYANNILDNRTSAQVRCNEHGAANHNYWGPSALPTSNTLECAVSNSKRLGAPILLRSNRAGVDALRQTVTTTNTSLFNGALSLQRSAGSNYDLIVVNHGQGADSNIPFLNAGAGAITPCSNFYDIFLAENAIASDLILRLRYDLNSACINTIESAAWCGQGNPAQYPLWWYDPANQVTSGWDRTGQNPTGAGAGGAIGQTTTCDMANDQLIVTIDNTGRPGLSQDLSFTPFVAGLPPAEGISLSQLTATFNLTKNDIRWVTSSESNVAGFHVLRSDTQAGPYTRISERIPAIGNPTIGGIYSATDADIFFTRTYYYKLEVVNRQGASIETYGPVNVLTSTATPTATLTRTPTRTSTSYPTRTPYYYRSPTSYYRRATATPRGGPTPVRTYGPTPTPNLTEGAKPPFVPTEAQDNQFDPDAGYPVRTADSQGAEGYPSAEDGANGAQTPQPGTAQDNDQANTDSQGGATGGENPYKPTGSPGATQPPRWSYLLIGIAGGLTLLAAVSGILIKTRLTGV